MAVLVSLERKIALDLRHAFEMLVVSDDNEKYLSILYANGGEILEETFKLRKDTDTNGLLRFLAEFKNLSKVIIYEDLIDGFKQTKVDEAISTIRKLKAENERLKRSIADLMGYIQSLREQLEALRREAEEAEEEEENSEIIPVADPGT